MEEKNRIEDKVFMDKIKVRCIYIASVISYFLLRLILNVDNIQMALIFRIYYIVLGLSLFILLKQIRRFNERYVSTIIWLFFSLIIIISMLGFVDNITQYNIFIGYVEYIDLSINIILLLEVFICYILSEYYFRNVKVNKLFYIAMFIIFFSMILTYRYKILFDFIKVFSIILEIPLIINVYLNIRIININKKKKLNIIKCCILSISFIVVMYAYEICTNKYKSIEEIIEVIHLSNFTIIWSLIVKNFVTEPYKELATSLSNETKNLDKLNKKITMKNDELEQSINILRNNEHLYSTFFRYMPHPIIILNSNNGRVLFANKQFLHMAKISSLKKITNKKITKYIEFLKEELANKNYNAILNVKNKKKFIYTKILPKYLEDGNKIILIKDNTSNVIKEKIEKEVKNKKIEEGLRTQFLSSISHDLKTPINVIYSANQIEELYIKKMDFKALKKYNSICKDNCISLIKLTNNLIDNSQIKSHYLIPRLKKYNLVEIIEDNVMSLVEYAKWNGIELIFDTNTEECYLDIDQEFMDRIILNLISNAVKFTGKNGKIHVIIQEEDEYVRISINDNGIGMKKEFIKKAFDIYEVEEKKSENSKNESGIGLFVVKQLVELQGGNIHIESHRNIGTNIIIIFKKEK